MALFQIGPQAIKPTAIGEISSGLQVYQAGKQRFEQQKMLRQLQQAQIQLQQAQAARLMRPEQQKPTSASELINQMKLMFFLQNPEKFKKTIFPEKKLEKPPTAAEELNQMKLDFFKKHPELFKESLVDSAEPPSANEQLAQMKLDFFKKYPDLYAKSLIKPEDEGVKLQIGTTLRKEFQASDAFKNFQTIRRSEQQMKMAYQMSLSKNEASRIASDQALGVLFQKMLDPTSVVRESEYARTAEGVSAFNRIRSFLPKLQKGGLGIADEDRKALYDMANKFLDVAKTTLNESIDRYTQLAKLYKIRPELIFGGIQKFGDAAKPALKPLTTAEQKRLAELEARE